jgi:integration host factor subunit beta
MLKSQLIERLAGQFLNISVHHVAQSVNLLIETMSEALSKQGRIEIRGFGSFALHHYPPRRARNPKTGKTLIAPAKYRPHFKPGKELREQVNF